MLIRPREGSGLKQIGPLPNRVKHLGVGIVANTGPHRVIASILCWNIALATRVNPRIHSQNLNSSRRSEPIRATNAAAGLVDGARDSAISSSLRPPARGKRCTSEVLMEVNVGEKVTIKETEEIPVAPGVKVVRDITADDPKPKDGEVIKEKVTIEKTTDSDD